MRVGYLLRYIKRLPFVSICLVSINVIVYLMDIIWQGWIIDKGNLNVYDVMVNGEIGRILWAMFLHADMNHLFNNMIILLFMGNVLEKAAGHGAFLGTYLLSGVAGNVFSLIYKLLNDRMTLSIGASGAVFGMDGLLLAWVLFSRGRIPGITPVRVTVMVVLSLYNGFTSYNIDNAAHIGGLLTGFLCGCFLCALQQLNNKRKEE